MPIDFTCPYCGKRTIVADHYAGSSGACAGCGQTITIPGSSSSAEHPISVAAAPPSSSGSKLPVIAMIVVGCLALCLPAAGILVAIVLPTMQGTRPAAYRMQCSNNMKQIALALHNYHDVHQCFPPAYTTDKDGKPIHSWRVLILPFVEQQALYERYDFDEPWDSPNNLIVAAQMPELFRCPEALDGDESQTNYVVVIGCEGTKAEPGQTVFMPEKGVAFRDITDGTSNTIAVVEVLEGVPWTKPDAGLKLETMKFQINAGPNSISSDHPGIANVALADGSVRPLREDLDSKTLRDLFTIDGGEPIDRAKLGF